MTNVSHIPGFPLNCYVDKVWYTDAPTPYAREKILPAPYVDLMINFGDPFRVYVADDQQTPILCAESWSSGLQRRYHIVAFPAQAHVLSVSFKPGGAYPFLQLPLSELQDQVVSLDALWGRFAAEIRERLYDVPTVTGRIALLERLLLERLCENPSGFDAVQFAVDEITRSHGALSIRALSDQMGISQKHLITRFKRMVGMTPKALARVYRFQYVLETINPLEHVDWAQIAHHSHYYDQSHLTNDFEAFTGHSPGEYLRLKRQVYAEHADYAQAQRHLPTG